MTSESFIGRPIPEGEIEDPELRQARAEDAQRIAVLKQELSPDEAWELGKEGFKDSIRRLVVANPDGLKANEIIERVTGIHVPTSEERQRLALARSALSDLIFSSCELQAGWSWELTPAPNFQTPEAEEPAPSQAPPNF